MSTQRRRPKAPFSFSRLLSERAPPYLLTYSPLDASLKLLVSFLSKQPRSLHEYRPLVRLLLTDGYTYRRRVSVRPMTRSENGSNASGPFIIGGFHPDVHQATLWGWAEQQTIANAGASGKWFWQMAVMIVSDNDGDWRSISGQQSRHHAKALADATKTLGILREWVCIIWACWNLPSCLEHDMRHLQLVFSLWSLGNGFCDILFGRVFLFYPYCLYTLFFSKRLYLAMLYGRLFFFRSSSLFRQAVSFPYSMWLIFHSNWSYGT